MLSKDLAAFAMFSCTKCRSWIFTLSSSICDSRKTFSSLNLFSLKEMFISLVSRSSSLAWASHFALTAEETSSVICRILACIRSISSPRRSHKPEMSSRSALFRLKNRIRSYFLVFSFLGLLVCMYKCK